MIENLNHVPVTITGITSAFNDLISNINNELAERDMDIERLRNDVYTLQHENERLKSGLTDLQHKHRDLENKYLYHTHSLNRYSSTERTGGPF